MGGITIDYADAEQVVTGTHRGVHVIVLSVKPDEGSAMACWGAARGLVDTLLDAGSEMEALVIDISTARVRHAFITEMEET